MTCTVEDLRRTHETHKTLFIRDRPQNLVFVFQLPLKDIFRAKLPPKLELPVSTKYNAYQQEYGFYFSWLFTLLFLYCLSNLYFSFLTGLMGLQRSLLLWFLLFFLVVIHKAQVSQLSFLWQIDFIPLDIIVLSFDHCGTHNEHLWLIFRSFLYKIKGSEGNLSTLTNFKDLSKTSLVLDIQFACYNE